jgi:hypothetical protein
VSDLQNKAALMLHILTRWRTVFAGWQLGTRDMQDPECQALRDHRELGLILRAEMSALASLLINKGVITEDEWWDALADSAADLNGVMERRFPGFKATPSGMDVDVKLAAETTRGWPK